MFRYSVTVFVLVLIAASASTLWAADAAPAATAASSAARVENAAPPAVTCTAKEVSNTVEWRTNREAAWQALKAGDQITVGSDIRTGFRAKCLLEFLDQSSVMEVQPLTLLRVGEFVKEGDKVRTRLYLKQGSTRAVVEKGRFQSDFAIVTPEVTMAVRGTRIIEFTQHSDFGPSVHLTGRGLLGVFSNFNGQHRDINPGESTEFLSLLLPGSGGDGHYLALAQAIESAEFNHWIRFFDLHGGLTDNEQFAFLHNPSASSGQPSLTGFGSSGGGGNDPRLALFTQLGNQSLLETHPQDAPGYVPPPTSYIYTPPSPYRSSMMSGNNK